MAYPTDQAVAQRVLDAVIVRLKTIAPPSYATTVNSVVLMEPGQDVLAHGNTVLAVLPGSEAKSDDTINRVMTRQRFLIGGTMRAISAPADFRKAMRRLLADVEQAFRADPQLGGLAYDTHVLDPTVLPRTGTTLVQGELELEVVYAHAYHDVSLIS